jgi:hypothetical protein
MDKSDGKPGRSSTSPRLDLQAAVAKELAKNMMAQMHRGEGFFSNWNSCRN